MAWTRAGARQDQRKVGRFEKRLVSYWLILFLEKQPGPAPLQQCVLGEGSRNADLEGWWDECMPSSLLFPKGAGKPSSVSDGIRGWDRRLVLVSLYPSQFRLFHKPDPSGKNIICASCMSGEMRALGNHGKVPPKVRR